MLLLGGDRPAESACAPLQPLVSRHSRRLRLPSIAGQRSRDRVLHVVATWPEASAALSSRSAQRLRLLRSEIHPCSGFLLFSFCSSIFSFQHQDRTSCIHHREGMPLSKNRSQLDEAICDLPLPNSISLRPWQSPNAVAQKLKRPTSLSDKAPMHSFILISCNSQDPYSETRVMMFFTHRPILLNR